MAVRLFPCRAEVSRRLKFSAKAGRNNVIVSGLPRSLLTESVKLEANGAATISEVTTSSVPVDSMARSNPDNSLNFSRREAAEALYMESIASPANVAQNGASLLEKALSEFSIQAASIDGVTDASLTPEYELRANTTSAEKQATLLYRASIKQTTGESWDDVALILETATPSFDTDLPTLDPWITTASDRRGSQTDVSIIPPPLRSISGERRARNIYATYLVPGKVSVPNGGNNLDVTITQLELDTKLTWITIPKKDARATVRNDSEFILIPGRNSVYVDGNFVGNVSLPMVHPQETFDCPLGIDTAINVNYHPQTKRTSKAGFLQRTSKAVIHEYSQQVTITNSGSSSIPELIVIDQIPKAEDPRINVKLLTSQKPSSRIDIDENVSAQWFTANPGAPELSPADNDGVDGRLSWRCCVPPQRKVRLHLQWEISVPFNTSVVGL
ncbi:hypothetical protein PC9H_010388 [Pleurotus ostreatus]|uniref:DUF4139 domain-containing protein n=1 Tax=Pleurotus ostreatus TaxID=5322 RepID=A0A8H7DN93_PLEOS|nr:uncharacterized protein PC9H_010388 [Pleurotus ostreatus]KAF7422232.1 hypothetical protein PC9H_010388 [Pleurotus ostreatus]